MLDKWTDADSQSQIHWIYHGRKYCANTSYLNSNIASMSPMYCITTELKILLLTEIFQVKGAN